MFGHARFLAGCAGVASGPPAVEASYTRGPISTFSCEIAHAVSLDLRVTWPGCGEGATKWTSEPRTDLTVSRDKLLSIYLNDHLAGATLGIELAKRSRASNKGTPLGDFLDRLLREIETDRETLERLMRELGLDPIGSRLTGPGRRKSLGA